jgi:hypothetical protein
MRIPRMRFTVRRLIALIAVIAATIFAYQAYGRRSDYLSMAEGNASSATRHAEYADSAREMAERYPDKGAAWQARAKFLDRQVAQYRLWESQYRYGASHPWISIPLPTPPSWWRQIPRVPGDPAPESEGPPL